MLRGIEGVVVTPGEPPRISFTIERQRREITPRLIVGADGRGSGFARQIGASVETAPLPTHGVSSRPFGCALCPMKSCSRPRVPADHAAAIPTPTWIDTPVAPGVVLIGDAAGHNDPTIGQRPSIALRDARLIQQALLDCNQWISRIFSLT